jgi:phage terminase large subunit
MAAPPITKTPIVKIRELNLVLYALQPKQLECYKLLPLDRPATEPYAPYVGYGGAAGGGKSHLARAVFTDVALRWPGSTAILFRKTEREVVANHVNKFRSEVPAIIAGRQLYKYNGNDLLVNWFNGSRTYFGYLRNDDDVFTYQGPEYDAMIFEEATHYSHFQVNWLTGNRLRATVPMARPFALFPSNPGGPGHFWYKRWFVEKRFHLDDGERPEDFIFVQAKLIDNQELMQRDPRYAEKLDRLPEPWRSWQRDGDFSAGAGSALAELRREIHLIAPFERPPHWPVFGSFDWGYNHPFAFGLYTVSEDGVRYKIDTVTGRRLLPHEIAERVKGRMQQLHIQKLSYITAGHDAWAEIKARGEMTPTVADTFGEMGLPLLQANIDRKMGLQELRRAFAWQTTGPAGGTGEPMLRFFDTDMNRRCFEQLETRVIDPDDPEDVLKTDADEWGEGGDDLYDETRYAIASRPSPAKSTWGSQEQIQAWSPEALAAERERLTRGRGDKVLQQRPEQSYEELP